MGRFALVLVLCVILAAPVWADANAGYRALRQGDYATAWEELSPPAQQGDPEVRRARKGRSEAVQGARVCTEPRSDSAGFLAAIKRVSAVLL